MSNKAIYYGNTKLNLSKIKVSGKFVEIENEKYYRIGNYNEMDDFFISIVSDADHWMFISSNGALSAGRKDRDNALFPYTTVDKIHDSKGITGSKTYILAEKNGKNYYWEPFTDALENVYSFERNLYKSVFGNKIIFEEINHDLEIAYRYGWYNSKKFGFIKKSQIQNFSTETIKISFMDGVKNILPCGVNYVFQNEFSNLLDAYKKNERIEKSNIGIFRYSSIPVDKAEPSEALKTTVVWTSGLKKPTILISDNQIDNFKSGCEIKNETNIRAAKGAYFVHTEIQLKKVESLEWMLIADVNQDSSDVNNLNKFILSSGDIKTAIDADILNGTNNLKQKVSSADGFQKTNTELCYVRHYSNTLYNIMRGGIFENGYLLETNDYKKYVWQINKNVSREFASWINKLPQKINYLDLLQKASETEHPDLLRISYEYLPLTFSRRHGDPSRPWNNFSIETINPNGSIKYNYEGNWRDIFQNWEALSLSFPEYIEGIICKFVNASTVDGYNPYRIMREGIDWESPDPDDPWAYIGYWGDHQIIYLLKMLELSDAFHPGKLDQLLISDIFTYANVPYRIKSYDEIVQNPKDTIVFDHELNAKINNELEYLGADAKLLKFRNSDSLYRVNLAEKILVTLLSKLSNFIPEAGIWLNTQRPEWNDANNALVGNGTSMVTLYYLRRFLKFWELKFRKLPYTEVNISEELVTLFENIFEVFTANRALLKNGFSDTDRKSFADAVGRSGSKYRDEVYNFSFSGIKKKVLVKNIHSFIELCMQYIDQSIRVNKREDGLYHAYNLVTFNQNSISIRYLYEMLEGQVAVLSSGYLSVEESLDTLNALKRSKLFRDDQYSYILYPDRRLPYFLEKNNIPENKIEESQLLKKMLAENETSIIQADNTGKFHFNGEFRNANVLSEALDDLRQGEYSQLIELEKAKILDLYEEIFDHQSFTGRSGTFFGYEGLGSIYWHMVSKLLLATNECYYRGIFVGTDQKILNQLKDYYYEIKAGIGLYKSPELYGAFPTDAYSHTPADAGVKQPGLTGQVKEDIISRMGELGIRIINGKIHFIASLLNHEEILLNKAMFEYTDLKGALKTIKLQPGQIAFTFCQIPIIYSNSRKNGINITLNDSTKVEIPGNEIGYELSTEIFTRSGNIQKVEVSLVDFFNG